MAKGGYRPGAGRKKGLATIEREKAKEYIAQRIGEYMPEIFQVLVDKALEGDIQAIRELLDRGFGKPAQAITGEGGGALVIQFDNALASASEGDSK